MSGQLGNVEAVGLG